ncbi:MAG TPA: DUF1289 domain-containing protein [Rhodocyclaceae bacterium]
MSNDSQCVGVCMIDPDTGACLGCGRLPEEIHGVPVATAPSAAPTASTASRLPPAVAAQLGEGTQ